MPSQGSQGEDIIFTLGRSEEGVDLAESGGPLLSADTLTYREKCLFHEASTTRV